MGTDLTGELLIFNSTLLKKCNEVVSALAQIDS